MGRRVGARLQAHIHLRLRRVRYRIAAELGVRTADYGGANGANEAEERGIERAKGVSILKK